MVNELVTILDSKFIVEFNTIDKYEESTLMSASKLLQCGFPAHSLMDIWNASVHNLRRRVEAYGIDMLLSSIKDESGRKKYNKDGDTIPERWSGVDDLVLISGVSRLGILNKKASKALEMVNWMRNHASPAHDSDDKVDESDVLGLVLILQKNLFEASMPDPGHSPSGLFEPIKKGVLDEGQIQILQDQINSFNNRDIRTIFGFMLDIFCNAEEPSYTNVVKLFPVVWEKATDELKLSVGMRYHSLIMDSSVDESSDKGAKTRLVEFLISVDGIKYIPDSSRAVLYRKIAKDLAKAKDTAYGWSQEEAASKSLKQLGVHVPAIAFEEVYQEILAVWCGNYWGRSESHYTLKDFINLLNTNDIMKLSRMFLTNERVKDELTQTKPNMYAINLLNELKESVSIQNHINEINEIIAKVKKY
ncbi:hypothetical protein FDF86_01715 [Clostridium botulinum]|nr:hypothetical protein [Clostridium botulinum]